MNAVRRELHSLPGESGRECYRFGHALLEMSCTERTFSDRFKQIFSECSADATEDETLPRVEFQLTAFSSDPGVLAASVIPNQLDGADFMRRLVADRPYVQCPEIAPGWQTLALSGALDEPLFAFGPSGILVSRSHPWQNAMALYAIGCVFRLQPDVYVLHAASVGIGSMGVLFSGPKGAGKTTLSLCLASRDHAFLGDEWAAVSSLTGELLPLRRAASIRPGPQPALLDEYLQGHYCDTETLPDGTHRVRAKVSAVFPRAVPQVVPLTDIFFLRRFDERSRVQRFTPGEGEFPPISPLLASVWGRLGGERAMELLRVLGKARWWSLDVGGSPEETADLVEVTLKEGSWD